MSLPARIRPEAEADLQSAYRWYEDQADGLGVRFIEHVDEAFARVSKNPDLYEVAYRGVRRALLKKFPYVVFFIASGTEVEVIAVLHAGRNPNTWRERT